jgi:hypothetical protein
VCASATRQLVTAGLGPVVAVDVVATGPGPDAPLVAPPGGGDDPLELA